MIKEFLEAFLLVFIAEFGDKSQILAMTLAIRYPVKKVLLGILIGAFLNNGLAVLLGSLFCFHTLERSANRSRLYFYCIFFIDSQA